MTKVLVTGGAGFIGSNIVDALIEKDHEVGIIDNMSAGRRENINDKAKFYESDITDRVEMEKIFEQFKPEAVCHLAAQINLRVSVEKPLEDAMTNFVGTANLLECSRQNGVKKFIYSSTGGAIYGQKAPRPTPETAEEHPMSPYGMNKLASERYIEFYTTRYELPSVRLRYANVYGPRQNPKGNAGVIAIFGYKMLQNEPVEVFGDGTMTRDYVYIGDVVRANLLALDYGKSDVFNIGTAREVSVNEITDILKKATGYTQEIKHMPEKPGEQQSSSLNFDKAKEHLNWEPEIALEEGIKKTVEFLRQME